MIGRDHLDAGSVASPNRETEGMKDGSDAVADWPILNALINAVGGATWVSVHHGGGVGMGYSIHAGMVIVADGTDDAARRLERVLTSDPGMGVARHADAGYDRAAQVARERGVRVPMLDRSRAVSPAPTTIPRPDLVAALVGRAGAGAPLVLTGPPGAGKTALLLQAAAELRGGGAVPVYLDLFGAVSSAERFVRAALAALPAGGFGPRLAEAVEIRRRADAGRLQGEPAVRALLELLAAADRAGDRPLVLLLDEPTEIRSLAYFPGLRQAHALLAAALRRRPRGTLLASSFPTQAREMFGFEALALPPLSAAELVAAGLSARAAEPLLRLTGGLPRYLRVLLEAGAENNPLAAWSHAMTPGGAPRPGLSLGLRSRCCCAAGATACRRPCWRPWRRRKA